MEVFPGLQNSGTIFVLALLQRFLQSKNDLLVDRSMEGLIWLASILSATMWLA